MDARPLSEEEVERLSGKAARLAEAMRERNPTQDAWETLRWLEDAVRQKELRRDRIGAIRRVLQSFDVQ